MKLTDKQILEVVGKELLALARTYRADWSDFDGRTLRDQLVGLVDWSVRAHYNEVDLFEEFTEFEMSRTSGEG